MKNFNGRPVPAIDRVGGFIPSVMDATPPLANSSVFRSGQYVKLRCGKICRIARVTRRFTVDGERYILYMTDAQGVEMLGWYTCDGNVVSPQESDSKFDIVGIYNERRELLPVRRPFDSRALVWSARLWAGYRPEVTRFYARHMRAYGAERKRAA